MATELWTAVAVKMSGKQIIGFTVVNTRSSVRVASR